jgi:hypothetical protein
MRFCKTFSFTEQIFSQDPDPEKIIPDPDLRGKKAPDPDPTLVLKHLENVIIFAIFDLFVPFRTHPVTASLTPLAVSQFLKGRSEIFFNNGSGPYFRSNITNFS